MSIYDDQLNKVRTQKGFIAALDQSGVDDLVTAGEILDEEDHVGDVVEELLDVSGRFDDRSQVWFFTHLKKLTPNSKYLNYADFAIGPSKLYKKTKAPGYRLYAGQ